MRSKFLLSGMIVAVTHLVACEGMDPVAPLSNDDGGVVRPAQAPVIVSVAAIGEFPPGSGSGISGVATLTRTNEGLTVDQDFSGLTTGNAYSIWWVIFDNPQGCDGGCDASDLGRRPAQGSLVNGGGFEAEGSSASYVSDLARHDVEGKQVWVGDPSGVDNPYRAEVHLVLRNHGDAEEDPSDLAVQTSTFSNFCNLPGPAGCLNVGAAVFSRPDSPGQGS